MRPGLSKLEGKKDLVGAEIGVNIAQNAIVMLEQLDIKKLYLVDIKKKPTAVKKIKKHKLEDKVKWIVMPSMKAVKKIKDNSLDFVYIDANHAYIFAKDDIKHWSEKVKKGGLVAGHDYDLKSVSRAIDEYVYENDIRLKVKTAHWWYWR